MLDQRSTAFRENLPYSSYRYKVKDCACAKETDTTRCLYSTSTVLSRLLFCLNHERRFASTALVAADC